MNYCSYLEQTYQKYKNIVCLGLDPVIDRIPVNESDVQKKIVSFFESILNQIVKRGIYPSIVKPNYAFFAQYGFEGLHALKETIVLFKNAGIPVILDAKRGDIGSTSTAYSHEAFGFFNADAVTLSPYMGLDSIQPFINAYPEKGIYVLCRTSNPSAIDFQDLMIKDHPLYIEVTKKICSWNQNGNIGAVVGATYSQDLEKILQVISSSNKTIPLLIPGIGTQGGDIKKLMAMLTRQGNIFANRINSSSAILYAHEKNQDVPFYISAINELEILINETNSYIL